MHEQRAATDAAVARLAARQHGVVTSAQLAAAGLGKDAVWSRAKSGRIHRIHRGVYAVGHPGLGEQGRWMAAVLACGGGAVLSHRSAASLWNLLPATDGPIDVTVRSSGGRKKRQGLRIHRCSSLPGSATTIRKRIAVTTPARTLTDLRRVVPPGQHRKAVRQAEFLGLPLGESECHRTRSELERLFLRLCRRHRLPPPEVNVRIGYYVVDFLWCHHRLIVEADGWGAHRGRAAFEDDHARDIELKLRGYEVLRFTYAQITSEPARVAAAIRAVMARSSPHARLKRQPAP